MNLLMTTLWPKVFSAASVKLPLGPSNLLIVMKKKKGQAANRLYRKHTFGTC